MGRTGLSALAGGGGAARNGAARKRKRPKGRGAGSLLRGGSDADDFLSQFSRQKEERQTKRGMIQRRLQSAGAGDSLFGRLFGMGGR